jgi:hypothetical protein
VGNSLLLNVAPHALVRWVRQHRAHLPDDASSNPRPLNRRRRHLCTVDRQLAAGCSASLQKVPPGHPIQSGSSHAALHFYTFPPEMHADLPLPPFLNSPPCSTRERSHVLPSPFVPRHFPVLQGTESPGARDFFGGIGRFGLRCHSPAYHLLALDCAQNKSGAGPSRIPAHRTRTRAQPAHQQREIPHSPVPPWRVS